MLKLEIITESATGSRTGNAARSSTGSATGSSTGIAIGCSAKSLTGSETGNSTGSTTWIWLHSGKESDVCLDPNLGEKKSCALTWYPMHILDVQNGKHSTSKCKMPPSLNRNKCVFIGPIFITRWLNDVRMLPVVCTIYKDNSIKNCNSSFCILDPPLFDLWGSKVKGQFLSYMVCQLWHPICHCL